jgi:hypothetical protein
MNLGQFLYTTISSSAAAAEFKVDFQRQRKSDWYRGLSNGAAEDAMRFGLAGYETTARIAAELADAYADAAHVWDFLEDIKDMAA